MTDHQKTWHEGHKATLTRGQRAADLMRNGMGSWPFVGGFITFMLIWAAINTWALATNSWDPYPYILLNLLLSMLAGLQGAILLNAMASSILPASDLHPVPGLGQASRPSWAPGSFSWEALRRCSQRCKPPVG